MTAVVPRAPRKLGASDLNVFPVGLGLMSLSGAYGKSADEDGIRVIHHAIDRGIDFLAALGMTAALGMSGVVKLFFKEKCLLPLRYEIICEKH